MTTAYTSLLGLALPVQGELTGVWGDTVNNSITSLLDTSVAGTTNVSTDTDVTLTTTTGAANTARQAILLFSGARTALRTVTAPAQSKIYTVINATTGGFSVKLVGSGPTTGLTIPNGASAVVAWNGSDFVEVGAGSIGNLVVNGTLTVTGATTLQSTLAVTGNITNTAGTANGVAYLNGSKVLTSGSALTFNGTQLGIVNGAGSAIFKLDGSSAPEIDFYSSGVIKSYIYAPSTSLQLNTVGANPIIFLPNEVEGMRLTSTGLGIGTSSPATALHVASGNFRLTNGAAFTTADSLIREINAASGSANQYVTASIGFRTGNFSDAGAITFGTANNASTPTERMRLDQVGNLGLGVTPSAWGSGQKAIQIGSTGIMYTPAARYMSLGSNFYDDGSNGRYLTNGHATIYQQNRDSGVHAWYNAPSGTAGNAITFTQAMTLDASGNLGVGTTSPSSYGRVVSSGGTFSLVTDTPSQRRLSFWSTANGNSENAYIQVQNDGATTNTGEMLFATRNSGGTLAERARITAAGNFGIGTSSPSQKLVVYEASTSVYSTVETGAAGAYAIFLARNPNNDLYLWNRGDNNTSILLSTAWDMQIQTGAAKYISFATNNTERGRFDASGNFLVGGTTASGKLTVATSETKAQNATPFVIRSSDASNNFELIFTRSTNSYYKIQSVEQGVGYRDIVMQSDGGDLLVGTTSTLVSGNEKVSIDGGAINTLSIKTSGGASSWDIFAWNSATSGNNNFIEFGTEASYTVRGSIVYNRAGGVILYNTTSDYRAKDISGPVTNSGALIDSTPVYMGKMKGATQERPMFIAHETPSYAHTGVKDAVDADGNPVYQQMDASALIPVMWAEIQSLRKRLADAGI